MVDLRLLRNEEEWNVIHDLRDRVLFRGRGRANYDRNHPSNKILTNYSMGFWDGPTVLGTIRVDLLDNDRAALRLVAILPDKQRHGLGRQMVQAAERFILSKGRKIAVTNAALDAEGFYAKLGYKIGPWPDPDEASSAPTVPMQKILVTE